MATEVVEGTTEQVEAEWPLLAHLKAMGWQHIQGARLKAEGERDDFREVLLERRLRAAVRRYSSWMTDDTHTDPAVRSLRAAARHVSAQSLPQANRDATDLLLSGVLQAGPDDRDVKTRFVDWSSEALEGSREERLARNDYVVVDQLRVCDADGKPAVLDLVLFVNGIPLVVIECKSPDVRDPLGSAIRDLRAYTGRPVDDDTRSGAGALRGVPHLFAPVQLLVAADGTDAALGTYSSSEEHYALWRSISSDYEKPAHLQQELRAWGLLGAKDEPTLQQQLTAIVLRPGNLLNIVRHYVFEKPLGDDKSAGAKTRGRAVVGPRTAKVVCRHQQYRTTEKIVERLRTRSSIAVTGGDLDRRGGVVWHTQGAGKSFTMQFLARRLHASSDPALNGITIVAVTDRIDLQRQLRKAVALSESEVREATSRTDLEKLLGRAGRSGGRAVIFATIQKFLGDLVAGKGGSGDTAGGEERSLDGEFEADRAKAAAGVSAQEVADPVPDEETLKKAARIFPECSDSERVLVLVDEAHRSHTSVLHACLRKALPNAARIGFTGTPLMAGRRDDTGRIFGLEPSTTPGGDPEFLDTYRMTEAERDKVVVPVRYSGRVTKAEVRDKEQLDECFEDLIEPLEEAERARVRAKYATPSKRAVAESPPLIWRKAADMLEHYVTGPLTGGFKAQVAVVSRKAAVLYRNAFQEARTELLLRVAEFDASGRRESLRGRAPESYTREESLLLRAWQFQELLRRIDFVPVISAGSEQKSGRWTDWTDEKKQRDHIDRFLRPFPQLPPDNPWAYTPPVEPNPVPAGSIGGMNPWSDLVWGNEAADPPPIAILIVKSMLLTGFDAPIEQALYLDRPIRDAELLQAIARVNRPARRKTEGLVVDYYGVLNNLAVTLAAYQGNPSARETLRDMADELPELDRTAGEFRAFLESEGIAPGRLASRAELAEAVLALSDPVLRASFDSLLGEFLAAVNRVLPHQDALEYVPDARAWSVLQMRVRRHYRDDTGGGFTMRGYGRKVRALIADHLEAQEVDEAVAPVSILAPDFDEVVGRLPVREAAAEQIQGLRYHLEERQAVEDRPVYRQLSAELERVLAEFAGRWDDILRELGPLVERARQAEQADPAVVDLPPMERKLHELLQEKLEASELLDNPEPQELRRVVAEVYDEITSRVSLASFGGQAAHVAHLEARLQTRLREAGYRGKGAMRKQVNVEVSRIASTLAGYAAQHLEAFRAEVRRE
ncbi:Type I restriction-modification system, restriction subunit R (EC [Streptomyces globisporus]|uniref:type I site-specific deoxyribonuclease n=1 Tax=Streptomyces globisporus TaxID=1908 RepID=A0ABN8V480_STRGL|nr:type I restriction endonuclease [Streptomyces globisporus]CAH9416144.1 Type I restriction-modification system, restriction subunit R (EC [Streptomyces globisporus]